MLTGKVMATCFAVSLAMQLYHSKRHFFQLTLGVAKMDSEEPNMADVAVTPFGWGRAFLAAEKVKERLKGFTAALEQAGAAYAVGGGKAVAAWGGWGAEGAVPNT